MNHQESALRVSDLAGLAWSPGYRILMSSQVIRSYTSFLESAEIFFFSTENIHPGFHASIYTCRQVEPEAHDSIC